MDFLLVISFALPINAFASLLTRKRLSMNCSVSHSVLNCAALSSEKHAHSASLAAHGAPDALRHVLPGNVFEICSVRGLHAPTIVTQNNTKIMRGKGISWRIDSRQNFL